MFLVDVLAEDCSSNASYMDLFSGIFFNPALNAAQKICPKTAAQKVVLTDNRKASSLQTLTSQHSEHEAIRQYRSELGVSFSAAPEAYAQSRPHVNTSSSSALFRPSKGRNFLF